MKKCKCETCGEVRCEKDKKLSLFEIVTKIKKATMYLYYTVAVIFIIYVELVEPVSPICIVT